jgi:hypothetical protein
MENAEVSFPSPASLSSSLQFHLPYNVTRQRYWLCPLPCPRPCDLSIRFKLHATSTPQSCEARWLEPAPGPGQHADIFHVATPASQMLRGGLRQLATSPRVASGKGKTAPVPPGQLMISTHHLHPEMTGPSKHCFSSLCSERGLFPTSHFLEDGQRSKSCLKASLIKGLVPTCQSTPQ